MKTSTAILALTLLAAASAGAQNAPARLKMRDAATHDQIVEIARKAAAEKTEPVFQPVEGKDPSIANRPGDLISRSDILCYGGVATLVPKRAILHIQKNMAGRIGMQDGAKIVNWREFHASNRAWITTANVSRTQAEGNEPMSEATVKSFAKESRIVVAVYHEGPISVLPLKVPEVSEEAPTAAAK